MNLKHSLIFFSAGIIMILFLFLMGAVPMSMLPASSQQQEQNDELDPEMPLKDDGNEEKQLTTTMTTTTSEEEEEEEDSVIPANTQTKPIDQMNCTELREFAFSFEEGWGSAVALHDERCS